MIFKRCNFSLTEKTMATHLSVTGRVSSGVSQSGGGLAALAATSAIPAESAGLEERRRTTRSIGIQIGAVSFVDEGTEKVLELLEKLGRVDTIYPRHFTYGRGLSAVRSPGIRFRPWRSRIGREAIPRRQLCDSPSGVLPGYGIEAERVHQTMANLISWPPCFPPPRSEACVSSVQSKTRSAPTCRG